jgi:hypothetical protein
VFKTVTSLSDIPVPPDGYYRRKNPNWQSPERADVYQPDYPTMDRGSLVPTELEEEEEEDSKARVQRFRMQVALEQERDDAEGSSSFNEDSVSERAAGGVVRVARAVTAHPSIAAIRNLLGGPSNATPAAGLYNTPEHDITLVQRGARKLGLHTGLMHKPRARRASESQLSARHGKPRGRALTRDSSWWMVVGDDPDAVGHLLDLQKEHVASGLDPTAAPGAVGLDVAHYNAGTPRGVVFSQLVLASALGGLIMFYGLSSL